MLFLHLLLQNLEICSLNRIFAAIMAKNLYIISGCNGAGKTTASYTVLPEILDCKEFVNADEIARGLSPFNPESVAKGGHNIPEPIARRRYVAGIKNLFELFMSEIDYWAIFDSSETPRKKIAVGGKNADIEIYHYKLYENMKAYVK